MKGQDAICSHLLLLHKGCREPAVGGGAREHRTGSISALAHVPLRDHRGSLGRITFFYDTWFICFIYIIMEILEIQIK